MLHKLIWSSAHTYPLGAGIAEAALMVDMLFFTEYAGLETPKGRAVRRLRKLLLKKYPHLKVKRPAH